MEPQNNPSQTFSPQPQQTPDNTDIVQAQPETQNAVPQPQQVQPSAYQTEALHSENVSSSLNDEPQTTGGFVYGFISVGLAVVGNLLPYITLFLSSSPFDSGTASVAVFYGVAGVLAIIGIILGVKSLRSNSRGLVGLAGFVLNLVGLMNVLLQLLAFLSLNRL